MHEIINVDKVSSVSVFVGTGNCNARCKHCAGLIHRKYAPAEDQLVDKNLIYRTLEFCHHRGARSLSISSSGEPTLSPNSVTELLELVNQLEQDQLRFDKINLYSNGIRIGEDEEFVQTYLLDWWILGLSSIYITVHSANESENAKIYGVPAYPSLRTIVSRIHSVNISVRANVVLSRSSVSTLERFSELVASLKEIGFDSVSAWPIRGADDKLDPLLSPEGEEMRKMSDWAAKNTSDAFVIRVLGEEHHKLYEVGQKLTLFPNGKLSNSWCNN